MTKTSNAQETKELQLRRLRDQFQSLEGILQNCDPAGMDCPLATGKWSPRLHLVHLARYHEIFSNRVGRILDEDGPQLERYSAEEDPEWARWQALSSETVVGRLHTLRAALAEQLQQIPEGSFTRIGNHPKFGPMSLADWTEFFLVHEGHHMYFIFSGLRNSPEK